MTLAIKGDQQRTGNWMQTLTGLEFYPLDPRPDEIDIKDISGALSKLCRYGGHCLKFYSVAEHSVLLSEFAPKELKLVALLHDASEAYLVDIPRPIKPFLENYAAVEEKLMLAIAQRFGFAWPMPAEIKDIDSRILNDERIQAMATPPRDWGTGEPLGIELKFWNPEEAEANFMKAFYQLLPYEK